VKDFKKMAADLNSHLAALNGLETMLRMTQPWKQRDHEQITADAARWAGREMMCLAVWLETDSGIDWLRSRELLDDRESRLPRFWERMGASEEGLPLKSGTVAGGGNLAVAGLAGAGEGAGALAAEKAQERPISGQLAAEQAVTECADNDSPWLICKKCAAAGKCLAAPTTTDLMEAMSGLASLVIGLQKNLDRVWAEVRRA
jgi:hypothetical protein